MRLLAYGGLANWPWGDLQPHSFDFLMLDPPWEFSTYSEKGEGKSAQRHYKTMPLDEIRALPIIDLMAPNALVWLWCTAPMLPQQIDVATTSWGLRYCTEGVWVKTTKHGKISFGTGYGLRGSHEPFILFKRGKPKLTRSTRSVIFGPVREHSRKPDEAFDAAEKLMPNANRVEIFSRTNRPGWQSFGDEAGKFDEAA